VNVIVPLSDPTAAPFARPNCAFAFSRRSRKTTVSPLLAPFGATSVGLIATETEVTAIVSFLAAAAGATARAVTTASSQTRLIPTGDTLSG
jgi:hypothetical protein